MVLPDIDWTKYLGAAEAIELAGFKHQTRGAKSSSSKYSAAAASRNSNTSNINSKYFYNWLKIKYSQPDIPGLEQPMLRRQPAIFSWVVMDLEMTSNVHQNPAEDHRVPLQRWLLQTSHVC